MYACVILSSLRALARKNNYKLAYNQEIVALGLANLVGAAFNSYTTTGSFSRSAINNSCGAWLGTLCLELTDCIYMFTHTQQERLKTWRRAAK
jgi:hypothetical protein